MAKRVNAQQLEQMPACFGDSAPPTPPVAPVDLAALTDLIGGDAEFAADLARSYVDNSRELYAGLRACLARDDRQQAGRLAHQLAGASANMQAAPLRELCLSLEISVSAADAAQLGECLTKIGAELARVCAALEQAIGPFTAAAQPAS